MYPSKIGYAAGRRVVDVYSSSRNQSEGCS
jgi:hypothetical protein